jgi:ribosomal-protein-alanine N-acetyltransferase
MNAQPVVCHLVPALAAEMAVIEAESNRPPWSEQLFAQEFAHEHARVLGARLGGRLVGFLICHVIKDEAHIMNFGVAREARGQGVGRSILTELLRELHAEAVHWVTLEVRRSNLAARKLYESVGFSEVGTRLKYYSDNGEDALVLRLNVGQFVHDIDLAER